METTNNNNFYCVILAGGKGRRLWPSSREAYPKQFVDFFGVGRTQLQQTYDRMARIVAEDHIFINTNELYLDTVRQQLPTVPSERIMAEPIHRNTAPSISWANHRISRLNPEASVIFTPSDQIIVNEEMFRSNVLDGLAFVAKNDRILTMGVKPTRPEPGYGYIQLGDELEGGCYKVQSFTEKPEREFAKIFMDSGEFYWNTGLYLANVNYMRECFTQFLPPILRHFDELHPDVFRTDDEDAFMREQFPLYPNVSVDAGVLEKSQGVCVMKCDFGWADLGTWHSVYEYKRKSETDNVVVDSEVMIEDCKGCIVKLPKGKLGVINGLDGYIVADEGNVLLICKKGDSSSLIRKYVNEAQMKFGEKYV